MKAEELITKIILDTFTEEDLRAYTNSRSAMRAFLLENKQLLSDFNVPVSHDGYYFGECDNSFSANGKYLIMGKRRTYDEYSFVVQDE